MALQDGCPPRTSRHQTRGLSPRHVRERRIRSQVFFGGRTRKKIARYHSSASDLVEFVIYGPLRTSHTSSASPMRCPLPSSRGSPGAEARAIARRRSRTGPARRRRRSARSPSATVHPRLRTPGSAPSNMPTTLSRRGRSSPHSDRGAPAAATRSPARARARGPRPRRRRSPRARASARRAPRQSRRRRRSPAPRSRGSLRGSPRSASAAAVARSASPPAPPSEAVASPSAP